MQARAQWQFLSVRMKNYYVKLYDKRKRELASGEFFGEQKNIPVDIALSYDAKKWL